LEELQSHAAASDATALLADLGQVLYSVECVQRAAVTPEHPQDSTGNSDNSSGNSSSWGGIVSGLAQHHASDASTLSSMLAIAEGLLEYAKSEGLKHTAALLVPGIMTLHQRLEAVKASTTGAVTASSAAGFSAAAGSSQSDSKACAGTAAGVGGEHGCAEQAGVPTPSTDPAKSPTKPGLRQRNLKTSSEGLPQTGGVVSEQHPQKVMGHAFSPENHQQVQQPSQGPQHMDWRLYRQACKHAVLGFQAPLEQRYKLWVAQRRSAFSATYSLLLVVWVAASMTRTAFEGWPAFVAVLPVHLAALVPWATSAILALNKQYR
jgi:hypothetical protein